MRRAFVTIGIVLIAIGSFLGYYGGKELLSARSPSPFQAERVLSLYQERLLGLIYKYQRDYASSKLVVARNGSIFFFDDQERRKTVKITLLTELYGSKEGDELRKGEFVSLMESLPLEYIRFHTEARFDNPFVVSVTEAGIKYLRWP